ncbi:MULTISPECIES: acyl-CoA thioesterase [Brevibacterium]|jgi:acyl-CoA thioesterase YciA|uniref:HotDog ACOT-type domain-containing protein n=1 Tax=Brevibacterium salitolerans TaxID=1403566 RepID=A0ABN2W9I4_9MICO|nr:hotdog domain-containing protein [Brevibacterium sp.]
MAEHGAESFEKMNFHTRKWVRPEDLNANGTLFGGSLLRWIDDEAVVYAMIQLGNQRIVTKYISEIEFVSSAILGDILEIGLQAVTFGRTSLTMRCVVRNIITEETILSIDRIVFVGVDEHGAPTPHGYDSITYARDRFPESLRSRTRTVQ